MIKYLIICDNTIKKLFQKKASHLNWNTIKCPLFTKRFYISIVFYNTYLY